MAIKHATTKAPGEKLFAVVDWNADHTGMIDYQMSITADALGLKLTGDEAAPGNVKYYGTDGAGIKGYHDLSLYLDSFKIKVSATDTTPKYISEKITSLNGTISWVVGNVGGDEYLDTTVVTGNLEHGDLAGLGDDDHTQYVYLDGRAGGQTIYGGQNANDNLDFKTTHLTPLGQFNFYINPSDDVIEFKDNSAIMPTPTPQINVLGGSAGAKNLLITADGGSIIFNDENLQTTGNLTDGINSLTIANAKTAYDHSQDNTQAHSDYLLNNDNDSTTGTLTMTGLIVSNTNIDSTASIKGGEAKDAIMQLWADEGDDNTDKWDLISKASDNTCTLRNNAIDVFRATSAGIISKPLNSMARGKKGSQTIGTGADTIISFDSEDYDNQSEFDIAVNQGRFTASVTGWYHVSATILFDSASWAAGNYAALSIYKNGVAVIRLGSQVAGGAITSYVGVAGSSDIYLTAGDYIDIRIYQNTGGNRSLINDTKWNYVSIHRFA